ncbi:hypothetical protein F4777DRAFT_564757 [Nemania sp. FL0916]|nr:hypothetical protein F4777DRAFT_564757 [Nemania sp. FL0916]
MRNALVPLQRDTTLAISKFLAMFGKKDSSGFRGHAYIVLQVIRFCNVAVLLAVMVASVLMLIYAKLPNGYQFFADVVHAAVFFFAALLIFTEIGLWDDGQKFVAAAWPMLGSDRGFSGLGLIMLLIGCHLLGGLSNDTYTKDSVPSQISQVIIGAGIITIAFGFTNILASLLFRNKKIRAREVRRAGATTQDVTFNDNYDSRSNSIRKPNISGPMPMNTGDQLPHGAMDSYPDDNKSVTSYDTRHSPIMPEVSRPPTALHPAHRITHYSEASHLEHPFAGNMV